MNQHYTEEGISALRRRADRAKAAAIGIAAGTLCVCAGLCVGIRTANADLRRILDIVLAALGSWAAAALWEAVRKPALREAEHEEGVRKEPAQVHRGQILSVGSPVSIPRSIAFVPVTLREPESAAAEAKEEEAFPGKTTAGSGNPFLEEEKAEISLKLNARLLERFPPAGAEIRGETRRGYFTAWEPEKETSGHRGKPDGKMIFHLLRVGLGCLVLCALLVSWIFTFLTETDPVHQISLYADLRDWQGKPLAVVLEEKAPEGIRFVQAHPFTYALMDSAALEKADLYITTESQMMEYLDWIAPLPEGMTGESLILDGVPTGLRIFRAETGEGAAKSYLNYTEQPGEDWYLFFGKESLHTGEKDHAAEEIARELLKLP